MREKQRNRFFQPVKVGRSDPSLCFFPGQLRETNEPLPCLEFNSPEDYVSYLKQELPDIGASLEMLVLRGLIPLCRHNLIDAPPSEKTAAALIDAANAMGMRAAYLIQENLIVLAEDIPLDISTSSMVIGAGGERIAVPIFLNAERLIGQIAKSFNRPEALPALIMPPALCSRVMSDAVERDIDLSAAPALSIMGGAEGEQTISSLAHGISVTNGRENNEDGFFIERLGEKDFLLAAADGIGGGERGEEASRIALTLFWSAVVKEKLKLLPAAVLTARRLVGWKEKKEIKAGATLAAARIQDNYFQVLHVGDTRVYKISAEGERQLLTIDHSCRARSLAGALPRFANPPLSGQKLLAFEWFTLLSARACQADEQKEKVRRLFSSLFNEQSEKAFNAFLCAPERNVLSGQLACPDTSPALFSGELLPGDALLIVSDGICEALSPIETHIILFTSIARGDSPEDSARRLVACAREANPRGDNLTAVFYRSPKIA